MLKKSLKTFNDLYYHFIEMNYSVCLRSPLAKDIKLNHNIPEKNADFLISLMANIEVNKLNRLVFDSKELYQELLKYLNKYKLLGMNEVYKIVFDETDNDFDSALIASLISNFELVIKTKKEKIKEREPFGFMDELAFADVLNSDATIYSSLLGKENYNLIKSNPGPNSASMTKKDRLNIAIDLRKKLHERKYITVKPFDENIDLKSDKKINICLGNTDDERNLTYGERTGACMRIGGAGQSLFNFCLLNENGFHISFNHPVTGKLISRISGFRNGNTVFLNQLRTSLDSDYSDEDLKEACKIVGKKIIEMTKDSEYPIVNVVASDGYVFKGSNIVDLGIKNYQHGLLNFYCDINPNRAVIIATANKNRLLPIELGPNKSEKYPVSRKKIKKYEGDQAANYLLRIEALDQFYSDVDISDIDTTKKEGISLAYVGEDWYIAITKDNEIINYIQKNNNIEAAKQEMNKYLKIIKEEINNISKKENKSEYKNRSTSGSINEHEKKGRLK